LCDVEDELEEEKNSNASCGSDESSDESDSDCISSTDSCDDMTTTVKTDPSVYDGATLTVSASISLILTYAQKHKLTGEAFADLLLVIEAHCPKPNNCISSLKKVYKYFKDVKENIVKHFSCSRCKRYLGNGGDEPEFNSLACLTCGRSFSGNAPFCIGVPIAPQIRSLFKGKFFFQVISYIFL
jgi:hypothetical protein